MAMLRNAFFTILVLSTMSAWAQDPPEIEWQRNLGGSMNEFGASIEQTADGGYIVCGTTFSNNGDVSGNHGNEDIWIVKLNAFGNVEWQRCLGGTLPDNGKNAKEILGGGYLVLGNTRSNNGDVSGNHGMMDLWLVRLDTDGAILWQRCYGGSLNDDGAAIKPTPDGGYILVGESRSTDGDLTANAGSTDYWVLKLDAVFDIQWQRTYGGSSGESVTSVFLTSDGGYVLNGHTSSNDGDVSGAHGLEDYWLLKLDALGNIQWQRASGGSNSDYGRAIGERDDGGFWALGTSYSQDGDVSGPLGSIDLWAISLSGLGQLIDEKSYGGSASDSGTDLHGTADGGLVYCGSSNSIDGDLPGNQGLFDAWAFRTDPDGNMLWNLTLGGSLSDSFSYITATDDGGYIATGQSSSTDGDLSGNNGQGDLWVLKLGPDPVGISEQTSRPPFTLYPNPCRTIVDLLPAGHLNSLQWHIADATGRTIRSGSFSSGDSQLNVSSLTPGKYTMFLGTPGRGHALPFIKQ